MTRGKTITSDALKALGVKRLAEVLADACKERGFPAAQGCRSCWPRRSGAASWNTHA